MPQFKTSGKGVNRRIGPITWKWR